MGFEMSDSNQHSIKRNYFLNLTYQILIILAPLVTTPYLSRVLRADGIGVISFAESVSSYFVLFATMGIATFGQREISYVREDIKERTRVFWETKLLEIVTGTIAVFIYIPFMLHQSDRILYLILIFNLLGVLIDVTWFYQGLEEFGKIVIRNIVVKAAQIAFIFLFVKTADDLYVYIFGLSFFGFLGGASLWIGLTRYLSKPVLSEINIFRNINTVISLFLPTIAIQVYTVLDKTMIGLITHDAFQNGYYEQATKVSKMTLVLVTALVTVMIPRIGYHYKRGETDHVRLLMYRGYRFVWFMGIPLCFGLIGISDNLVPWFLGPDFLAVASLIKILSLLILAIGISNITGVQYLIPTQRQNMLTNSVIMGAVTNLCLNCILIPLLQATGAAIASVAAETVVSVIQLYYVSNELSIKAIIKSSNKYIAAGSIMLVCLMIIGDRLSPSITNTFVMIIAGAAIYFVFLLIMRDAFFIENSKKIINDVVNGLIKRN